MMMMMMMRMDYHNTVVMIEHGLMLRLYESGTAWLSVNLHKPFL